MPEAHLISQMVVGKERESERETVEAKCNAFTDKKSKLKSKR